ncbi:MAG: hypothetical protein HS111_11405 [Kofleriaceae bacterium]|nr:hypothetical protein [Kofleriaceae bacterium]
MVEQAMEALALFVETPSPSLAAEVRWFSSTGSVVVRGSRSSVFVGGLLLGEFDEEDRDRGRRNVLAVAVAKSRASGSARDRVQDRGGVPATASAAGEVGGPAALLLPRMGANGTITAAERASWREQFEAG